MQLQTARNVAHADIRLPGQVIAQQSAVERQLRLIHAAPVILYQDLNVVICFSRPHENMPRL